MSGPRSLLAAAVLVLIDVCITACGGGALGSWPDTQPPGEFLCPGDGGSCPIGATCLPSGGCWNAETANAYEDAGCNAVACEALSRSALETGNDCVELCAAWCFSSCAGDPGSIAADQQQMVSEGCALSACAF